VRLVVKDYYGPVLALRCGDTVANFYTDSTQSYLRTKPGGTEGTTLETWMAGLSATVAYVCVWYDQSGQNLHATNTNNDATQPTLSKQSSLASTTTSTPVATTTKWVLEFNTANSTVLNIGGAKPHTLCCQFLNKNKVCGTLITTNMTDYGQRLNCTTGTSVLGDSGAGYDWYYTGTGTKCSVNNGKETTTVKVDQWNTLSLSVQTPDWTVSRNSVNYDGSFNRIGQDGNLPATRSITGYMSEMLLYNKEFTRLEMFLYYDNRLF
jgi:hypothetical protein